MKPNMLAAALIVMLLAGCSADREPGSGSGLAASPLTPEGVSQSAFIGSSGGSVPAGGAEVAVPASAVRSGTSVTVAWDGISGCEVTVTGPPLLDAAILSMQKPPDSAVGRRYRILGYDSASGVWVDLGGTEVNGRVQIENLFIQYSIFDLDDVD